MTIEQRIEKLERELAEMRRAYDVPFLESLRRTALSGAIDAGVVDAATTSNINQTINAVPATSPDPFHKRVRVTINNTPYFIGLYDI